MEFYILKSGVCLAIFYGFYKLVLEKESFHVFKRFYLLVSAVLAFVIPLITFTEYIEVIPQEVPLYFPESPITNTIIEADPINYIPIILWSMYGFGVLLFSFKFIKNLSGIITKIRQNPKFKNQSFINVLLEDLVIPHTFLSYIFLNKFKFETHQIPKEVLLHEETHAKQKHSIDVLFIEILHILFWFNPFIYFIKRSIKLNHEFLADQSVINNGVTPSTYQQILLAFSSPDSYRDARTHQLANAINYSSIKKRFTVMKTHTSKKAIWLRSFILLPLLAILIYSFSEKKVIEKEASKPFVIQKNIERNGVTEAMMKEYRDFIQNTESTNMIVYPKYLRAIAIYDLMTEEQRNSVKKYPENLIPNLSNVKPKTPTEEEFNSWKDSNKYAIWIDGTHVKNSELNNYKVSDIKYFANSFVHNNARSEKYPQPYQNHLYTQKGFETTFTKSKKDNSALEQIKKELLKESSLKESEKNKISIAINENGNLLVNSSLVEINDLKSFLNDLTKDLSKKEKEEVTVNLVNNEAPKDVLTRVKSILRESNLLKINVIVVTETQQKIIELPMDSPPSSISTKETPEQKKAIDDYVKKHPESVTKMITESGEVIEVVEFPSEILPSQINQQKATPEEIKEYNDLIKKFITYKKEKQIYSLEELKRSSVLFEKMNKEQKSTSDDMPVMPPSPMPPIPALFKNMSKELTDAKKKFDEKSAIYYELVNVYFSGKEIDPKKLWSLYDESMNLYNKYVELHKKESNSSKK